jgi:hypothetical protein
MINGVAFEKPEYVRLQIDYNIPLTEGADKELIDEVGMETVVTIPELNRDKIFQVIDYQLQTTNKLKKYNKNIEIHGIWISNLYKVNVAFVTNSELMEDLRKVMFAGLAHVAELESILENKYRYSEGVQKFTASSTIIIANSHSGDPGDYINLYIGYSDHPKETSVYILARRGKRLPPLRKRVQRAVYYTTHEGPMKKQGSVEIRFYGFEPELAANFFQDKMLTEYIKIYYQHSANTKIFGIAKMSSIQGAKRLPMMVPEWLNCNTTIEELKTDKVTNTLNVQHSFEDELPKEYMKLKSRLFAMKSYTKHASDVNALIHVVRLSVANEYPRVELIVNYENEEIMLQVIDPKTDRSTIRKINDEIKAYCGLAKI